MFSNSILIYTKHIPNLNTLLSRVGSFLFLECLYIIICNTDQINYSVCDLKYNVFIPVFSYVVSTWLFASISMLMQTFCFRSLKFEKYVTCNVHFNPDILLKIIICIKDCRTSAVIITYN